MSLIIYDLKFYFFGDEEFPLGVSLFGKGVSVLLWLKKLSALLCPHSNAKISSSCSISVEFLVIAYLYNLMS